MYILNFISCLLWSQLCPHKIHKLKYSDIPWRWGLWEVILKSRGWGHHDGISVLEKRHQRDLTVSLSPPACCSVAQSCPSLSCVRLFATPWTVARKASHPSPTPGVYSNSCLSSQWCHPAISSSVIPFSSCPQSFPASGSFPMSQLSTWGGQRIGVAASASVLPMNTQDWSPLGWAGCSFSSLFRMGYLLFFIKKNEILPFAAI